MPIPKIVTQYEYEKFEKPGIDFNPSDKNSRSKAIQSDMDAADINKIMARFEKTGVIIDASGGERKPMYGDFTEIKDYHGMLSAVRNAERAFGLLPANVRNRFANDPQKLIDFLEDQKNDEEAVKLGLKEDSVLLVALADDGKTKITKKERDSIDANKLAREAADRAAAAAAAAAPKP